MNARCTTTSAPANAASSAAGSRTSPWRYPSSSSGARLVERAAGRSRRCSRSASSACSSGISPKPNVPVGPVTATVSGAAEAAIRERDPILLAAPAPGASLCACDKEDNTAAGDQQKPAQSAGWIVPAAANKRPRTCTWQGRADLPDEATPYERLLAHVEARLGLVPRYRQHLAAVPFLQGRRRLWTTSVRPRYHVRGTALPRRAASTSCGARRPVSSPPAPRPAAVGMWLVEGLDRGRFAILSKTHHALVDGVSGIDILSVLLRPTRRRRGLAGRASPSGAGLVDRGLPSVARRTPASSYPRYAPPLRRPRKAVSRIA